jgi:hypothetical protein
VSTKGTITPKLAAVTGTATTVTANGSLQSQLPATTSGFVSGESVFVTGLATGVSSGVFPSNLKLSPANAQTILSNYKLSINNALLTINPAIIANAPFVIEPWRFVTPISRLALAGFNSSNKGAALAGTRTARQEQACTPDSTQECDCKVSDEDLGVELCLAPKTNI